MSNKKILQGHNKALESLSTIAGIPIEVDPTTIMKKFGYTKMAVDTFTPTVNSGGTTNIPHSLGEIPKMVLICSDVFSGGTTTPVYYMLKMTTKASDEHYYATCGGFCYIGLSNRAKVQGCHMSNGYLYADKFFMNGLVFTDSTSTQIYWIAGVTYTIYTFA